MSPKRKPQAHADNQASRHKPFYAKDVLVFMQDGRLKCHFCKGNVAPSDVLFLVQQRYKVPDGWHDAAHVGFEPMCLRCMDEKFGTALAQSTTKETR